MDGIVYEPRNLAIVGHQALSTYTSINLEGRWENIVDSLMDSGRTTWYLNKITTWFNPKIVSEIMKINLNPTSREDRWMWAKERSRKFAVKSAYHLIRKLKSEVRGRVQVPTSLLLFGRRFGR